MGQYFFIKSILHQLISWNRHKYFFLGFQTPWRITTSPGGPESEHQIPATLRRDTLYDLRDRFRGGRIFMAPICEIIASLLFALRVCTHASFVGERMEKGKGK